MFDPNYAHEQSNIIIGANRRLINIEQYNHLHYRTTCFGSKMNSSSVHREQYHCSLPMEYIDASR